MNIKKPVFISILTIAILGVISSIYLPIHFLVIAPKERYQDYSFQYWNDCNSINELKTFVSDTVSEGSKHYVPKQYRVATIDMDGTLYGERAPIYIQWLIYKDYFENVYQGDKDQIVTYTYKENGAYTPRSVSLRDTYNEINDFINGVGDEYLEYDEANCHAKMFAGLTLDQYDAYVNSFFNKEVPNFTNLTYKDMIYKPMIEVVNFLKINNFDTYIVSGTDRFIIRPLCSDILGIPSNKIIGMDVELIVDDNNVFRGDKLMYKTVKDTKVELISQEIGMHPILSIGNSSGDIHMHELTLSNPSYHSKAFMIVADDVTREYGYQGEVLRKRIQNWDKYTLVSMANDWKTIYGDNVKLR